MPSSTGSKPDTPTIHLKVSLENGTPKVETRKELEPVPLFVDEARLLKLANMASVEARRNTESGSTIVHLLGFREDAQRQKLLEMLRDHFPSIVEQCIPLIRNRGRDYRASIRGRTAQTAGELMRQFDFITCKEEIVAYWAHSPSILMSSCVGPALAVVGQDERYAENVKKLVRHWLTVSNPMLNWTAMSSCFHLAALWPEEILDLVETALNRDLEMLIPALFVVRRLCEQKQAALVLKRLSEWANEPVSRGPLRQAGTLIFLEAVELSTLAGETNLPDLAVDIFLVGICDRKLPDAGLVRSAMFDKLREWCLEAFDHPEHQALIETIVRRLYLGIETTRDKERVVWYLQSWARNEKTVTIKFNDLAHRLVEK